MKITYTERDGIFYPNLDLPEHTNYPIGKYGKMRLDFLKNHRNTKDTILMLLLRKFSISDIENNRATISVQSEDIQKILKRFNSNDNGINNITE